MVRNALHTTVDVYTGIIAAGRLHVYVDAHASHTTMAERAPHLSSGERPCPLINDVRTDRRVEG